MSSVTVQQACPPALDTTNRRNWRVVIVLPREHGAWGILAIALLSGASVGYAEGGRSWSAFVLAITATMAAFLLRTPVEALLGISIIRPASIVERRIALGATCFWAALATLALTALADRAPIKPLFIPASIAGATLLLQLLRQTRRRRLLSELLGVVVLSGGAFVTYFAITTRADKTAAAVWSLNALFGVDQVLYIRLLIQRTRSVENWQRAKRAYRATSVVVVLFLLIGAVYSFLPLGTLMAYLPLLARAEWTKQPLRRINLRSVGLRELAFSSASGALLVGAFVIQAQR